MPEVRELWHECVRCGSIFDADTPTCTPCGAKNPRELHLTLREVLEHGGPTRVWTRWPGRFYGLLKEREEALAKGARIPEAVKA